MAQTPMRALIVDDEPHARRYMTELLEGEINVLVVGEASCGAEGMEQIGRLLPDIVFLDIQMPDLDGLDMVERLDSPNLPLFIFVTGYSEYAVRAFEVEAVDYLRKPFDKDRLVTALERAQRRLNLTEREIERDAGRWLTRLSIRVESGFVFVPVDQILWIEAANKYVVVHTTAGTHIARQTIQSLQGKLDPNQFVRIHRSTVVRKSAVRGLHPLFHGDYIVKLVNGAEVTLSRNFRASFFHEMGG
ncbi:MAG: LytTR family DNA-binding domain-containing protein [Terracidiphilus sp.]|jgi:two-component system LytT family response regulator